MAALPSGGERRADQNQADEGGDYAETGDEEPRLLWQDDKGIRQMGQRDEQRRSRQHCQYNFGRRIDADGDDDDRKADRR